MGRVDFPRHDDDGAGAGGIHLDQKTSFAEKNAAGVQTELATPAGEPVKCGQSWRWTVRLRP